MAGSPLDTPLAVFWTVAKNVMGSTDESTETIVDSIEALWTWLDMFEEPPDDYRDRRTSRGNGRGNRMPRQGYTSPGRAIERGIRNAGGSMEKLATAKSNYSSLSSSITSRATSRMGSRMARKGSDRNRSRSGQRSGLSAKTAARRAVMRRAAIRVAVRVASRGLIRIGR